MMEKYEAYLRRKRRAEDAGATPEEKPRGKAALDPHTARETGLRPEDLDPAPRPQAPAPKPAAATRTARTEPEETAPPASRPAPADPLQPAPAIRRPAATPRPAPLPGGRATPAEAWAALKDVTLDPRHLARQRIISATRKDPAHVAFDVLRTRLLAALRENGWRRVAVTSPTQDCGKTFVAANLAISLSRQDGCRTILMDMDLRRPSLARVMGVRAPGTLAEVLTGDRPMAEHLVVPGENEQKIGRRLALGLNGRAESYASELLQGPTTPRVLSGMIDSYDPDVVLYDLPPALYYDDVIAFREQFDGVLLVIGGGITRPREVHDVKRRLGEDCPLLGVIMNKAEGLSIADYSY